ncbi:MAG: HypC/HybG/HupF family hydrogenase formation chaperone [Candidatus Margulisiibacteriota bacterium]|jgi:biotin synthase
MCYAIPGIISAIQGKTATITYFTETKKAILEQTNISIGDYVYAQGGFVIEKISPDEAEKILETWQDLFFEFQELDNKASQPKESLKSNNSELNQIFAGILNKPELFTHEDALEIIKLNNKQDLALLYQTANLLRNQNLGNACCVHGILEISNYCQKSCLYCGINKQNTSLKRYNKKPNIPYYL